MNIYATYFYAPTFKDLPLSIGQMLESINVGYREQ